MQIFLQNKHQKIDKHKVLKLQTHANHVLLLDQNNKELLNRSRLENIIKNKYLKHL